jgi:hypothetical protein
MPIALPAGEIGFPHRILTEILLDGSEAMKPFYKLPQELNGKFRAVFCNSPEELGQILDNRFDYFTVRFVGAAGATRPWENS